MDDIRDSSAMDSSDMTDASVVDAAIDTPIDVNPQDTSGSIDESSFGDWNAFLPLATGSSTPGEPGTTPDVSGHGYSATYGFGVSFSNSALVLSESGDVTISSHAYIPAIDVAGSYSVSVWVRMNDTSGYRTFVSADGNEVSEFYLQKRDDTNRLAFALSTSDSNDGVGQPCIASASSDPAAFVLYHLVATRDATTGINTLYVNGVEAGTATCLASTGVGWAASTFGIGHGKYNGKNTDYVSGSISALGLVGRVLTEAEVAALYASGPG